MKIPPRNGFSKNVHMVGLLLLVSLSSSLALIRHCYPNTDQIRNKFLETHKEMKTFLESHPTLNGRLGLIQLANWQDPVLELKLEQSRLPAHLKEVKCRWRMIKDKSNDYKESESFNKKVYMGNDLHANPLNNRNYFRTVSCETDKCVQYWNIFVRPLTKPEFPVQVYFGFEGQIICSLDFMNEPNLQFLLANQNPPYTFEWTGPRDCKEENWHRNDSHCVRYNVGHDCDSKKECTIKLNPAHYPDTSVIVEKGTIKVDKESRTTQMKSILNIKKAALVHRGSWRCMVKDRFGISSHPDKESAKFLKDRDIVHRGIVFIRCKDIYTSIGVPLGLIIFLLLFVSFSIPFCRQCRDFDATSVKNDQPEEREGAGKAVEEKAIEVEDKVPSVKSIKSTQQETPVLSAVSSASIGVVKSTEGQGKDGKPKNKKKHKFPHHKKE